jgi:hypothetical protein
MITEKDLLKWGFEKGNEIIPPITFFRFVVTDDNGHGRYDYVEYRPDTETLEIYHDFSYLILKGVTTKCKADQALRLLGLPSIDKLNTIKK